MKNTFHKKSLVLKILSAVFSLTFLTCISANAQNKEQRIINTIPKHLPIKVEIINGDVESKLEDVKIKVTNIGEKPIYYLSLRLSTKEKFNGYRVGVTSMYYGNSKLTYFSKSADFMASEREKTIPLKTDEFIVFGVTKKESDLFYNLLQQEHNFYDSPKLELFHTKLSFGDGTGYVTPTGVKIPTIASKRV